MSPLITCVLMDSYHFLNTAYTAYFAELYDQYIIAPELVSKIDSVIIKIYKSKNSIGARRT